MLTVCGFSRAGRFGRILIMKTGLRAGEDILAGLSCPICRSGLEVAENALVCVRDACRSSFPIIEGVPVLINEANSLFRVRDYLERKEVLYESHSRVVRFLKRLVPSPTRHIGAKARLREFARLLLQLSESPKVLVVGGSILGAGMKELLSFNQVGVVESDVAFGPRTALICDAHDLPFKDETFDGVVAQAVLEHVVDPFRCVEEMHRVLKQDGIVYAETPFMQQVHGGPYDFLRFSHLGHRRLFRRFEEISSGAASGPAEALVWAYESLLLSLARSQTARLILKAFARWTSWWITYADYILLRSAGSLDAACAYYFVGRRGRRLVPDKEILEGYRGFVSSAR
jgi:SAM-dependent methyltransferase/uncharacterized protein YbaR (Trm112 family)